MKCEKCGHESDDNRKKHGTFLCIVCLHFSPDDKSDFKGYINEKIDGSVLKTFRKHSVHSGEKQKQGMIKKAINGNLMSRAPFGYRIESKKLLPAENHSEIENIFEEFL
ncbi:MAG TPA: hypothetical protein ENI22_00045, partial [Candidatus Pacearchaeota archaeon]|nr:hypothetical protein [Candidatus Pacearchaeota archaeon]